MTIKFNVVVEQNDPDLLFEIQLYNQLQRQSSQSTKAFDEGFPNHCLNGTEKLVDYTEYCTSDMLDISIEQEQYMYEVIGPFLNSALTPLRNGILKWITRLNALECSGEFAELEATADLVWENIECIDPNLETPWVYPSLELFDIHELPNGKIRITFELKLRLMEKSCHLHLALS